MRALLGPGTGEAFCLWLGARQEPRDHCAVRMRGASRQRSCCLPCRERAPQHPQHGVKACCLPVVPLGLVFEIPTQADTSPRVPRQAAHRTCTPASSLAAAPAEAAIPRACPVTSLAHRIMAL